MIKFRLYFDKDKETTWLNKMSADGWALKHFFAGVYTFEKCEKNQYTYQIDFGNRLFSVSKDYKEFMEETDVEIVQTWGFWVILRKLTSKGEFQLYTDVESSIKHYSKIKMMFKVITIVELLLAWFEIILAITHKSREGFFLASILLAFTLIFSRMTYHTKAIINELKERQTGMKTNDNRQISMLLAVGMLINACALGMGESISHPIKMGVQILAIVVMLVGIWKTARKKEV